MSTPGDAQALWFEVQQFLFREARMLDERRFKEWVGLFTDDLLYWAPILTNRVGRDAAREVERFGESAHFEDDKTSLTNRINETVSMNVTTAITNPSNSAPRLHSKKRGFRIAHHPARRGS